jgi:WD40 repeat protein
LGGLAGVTWKWLDANEQRDLANAHARQADAHARRAEAEKQAAQYQVYRASLAAASAALESHDVAATARHLESAPKALRGWEWQHLSSRLDDSASVISLAEERSFLLAAPDGLRVGDLTSAGLRLMDLEGGDRGTLPIGPERRRQLRVAQTSRGLRVVAWVGNSTFELLDGAGQVVCRVATDNDEPAPVVVSPDGTRLCVHTGGDRSGIAVFDATSGKRTAVCMGHTNGVRTYAFSPDGLRLASGSIDRTARMWDAATGTQLAVCKGHASTIHSATLSSDGARLVTASADGMVRQWDAKTGLEVEPPYDRHSADLNSAVYSPDGEWVASAGDDRTVRVWRARGRQDVAVLHGHTGSVIAVAFTPDGRRLASLSSRWGSVTLWDNTVRVWDVDPRATLPVLRGHTRTIYPVAYSPDNRWLASGSWDETMRLWDAATGELCATFPHPCYVWDLAFGPDGTWLVTVGSVDERRQIMDDRLRIWDVETARVRKEIPFQGRNFRALALSPDGTRLAATHLDPKFQKLCLTVIDVSSGQSLFSTEGWPLAYSPDGHWLAVRALDEKTVLLLDARTHETIERFSGHEKTVLKAVFSPDSRRLASCSRDHTVRVWQVDRGTWRANGEQDHPRSTTPAPSCQVLRGHTDEVYAVAFHPDGTRLATGGQDGAVSLWDLARGEEVLRLPRHKSFVWSLAFSPDGATLASGSGDTTVRLWDTAPLKTRYQARRAAAALRPEAERLVEQLSREKHDPAEVVKAIRGDRVPNDSLRHAALRAVLRRAQPPEAAPGHAHDPP